jgi:hypothetical protein
MRINHERTAPVTKPTPGPLQVYEDDECIKVGTHEADGDGQELARMTVYATTDPDFGDDVQRANARAFALASEMLDFIRRARPFLEYDLTTIPNSVVDELNALMLEADLILAKADGEVS